MSSEAERDLSDTPPFRHRFAVSLSHDSDTTDGGGSADGLRSSTSTAGPPGSRRTGRYTRPWALGSNTSCSSPTSPQRGRYRGASRRTGSFRAFQSTGVQGNVNQRSFSTASTVVSLIGSAPEWSRSFCVFSSGRAMAVKRQARGSMYFGHHMLFARRPSNGGAASSPQVPQGSENRQQQPSSVNKMGYAPPSPGASGKGHGFNQSTLSDACSPSAIFAGGQMQSPSASPLLGATGCRSWSPRPSVMLSFPSSPMSYGHYCNHVRKGGSNAMSPARREMAMLFRTLCCHLALTGTPFMSGNVDHPIDTRKGPLIGVGGFAKVYAGVDCVSGQLVAIKEINIAEVKDLEALNTIGKEFGILKSLRHPNIVAYQLFEHSASQKVCRIVMELLTGGSMLSLMQKHGPLREPILRRLARHILQAIAFIHKEGISHRDIKPANILISHKGDVKLCDFGCSKRVNELSKSSSCIIGTPVYMSPESIKGEANHKSDIWSMACSLFELATGMLPWYHAGVQDNLPLMFYITTSSETPLVLPVQENAQEFSPEFMDFMELCFTRDVRRRPEASELLEHPWITGDVHLFVNSHATPQPTSVNAPRPGSASRGAGLDRPLNGVRSSTQSFSLHDDESLLQHEFEDVSAVISVEMCAQWMAMMTKDAGCVTPESLSAPTDSAQRLDRQLIDAPLLSSSAEPLSMPSNQLPSSLPHVNSASASASASAAVASSISQSNLVDYTTLPDNFNYTVPLGASAGRFVLPSCLVSSSSAVASSQPQYLRINADGNLDFAAADDDDVEIDASGAVLLDDTLANAAHLQNRAAALFATPDGSAAPRAPRRNSHLVSSRSPVGRVRFSPAARNSSLSLHSSESFASRMASPLRQSPTSPTHSLHAAQQMSNLFVSAQRGATEQSGRSAIHSPIAPSSNDDATNVSQRPVLPENVRRDGEGRLCMSLTLATGGPEGLVNISLNVDPEDVQCKYIERRPSYVVAISNDVRAQLAAKFQEFASSSKTSTAATNTLPGGQPVMLSKQRSLRGFSRRVAQYMSSNSVSPTISPARRSVGRDGGGSFAGFVPRQGGQQWTNQRNFNNSLTGSCTSPVRSSSTSLQAREEELRHSTRIEGDELLEGEMEKE